MRACAKCIALLVICLLASACRTVPPLTLKDFSVSDGTDTIALDTPYKGFEISKTEEKIPTNYVGEKFSGRFMYKYYVHQYADLDLFTSNVNYNLKNRDFSEYHIAQITLKNSNFKTPRGMTVGSAVEEVMAAYGRTNKTETEGRPRLCYRLNDMQISFYINDQGQKVTMVILTIVAGEK